MYNPTDVPSEWRMWLKKLRKEPPSLAEMAKSEAESVALASKVAAIEEKERLARVRMQSMGDHARHASQTPDYGRVIQSMGGEDAGSAPSGKSEPKGSGDTFSPGTWKPGN